jgi:RNA polymerase sigma factor (sigma-70 family)
MQLDGYSQILALFPENNEKEFNLLRLKLVRFFEIQGAGTQAEDFADETISRVAGKLGEGVKIEVGEPFYYFRGFAQNVLREHWRSKEKTVSIEDIENKENFASEINPAELTEKEELQSLKEKQFECLEKTLKALPAENRQLFLDYHRENIGSRETWRAKIAARLSIDAAALRNRITRLRKKIEQLVLECLKN